MADKKLSTRQKIEINLFGYAWIATWFVSIWWEVLRWEFFWTGTLAAVLSILMYAGADDVSQAQSKDKAE